MPELPPNAVANVQKIELEFVSAWIEEEKETEKNGKSCNRRMRPISSVSYMNYYSLDT